MSAFKNTLLFDFTMGWHSVIKIHWSMILDDLCLFLLSIAILSEQVALLSGRSALCVHACVCERESLCVSVCTSFYSILWHAASFEWSAHLLEESSPNISRKHFHTEGHQTVAVIISIWRQWTAQRKCDLAERADTPTPPAATGNRSPSLPA